MNCDRSKALVSVYVDGELSEELAGPLRRHLMECAACRASVSEAKAMASWFVPTAAISVPEGFAARVARLAATGAGALDVGAPGVGTSGRAAVGDDWLVPSRASHEPRLGAQAQLNVAQLATHERSEAHVRPAHAPGGQPPLRSVDRTARFAMSLAAAAAAVLIGLTMLLASGDGGGFDGSSIQAQPSVENALSVLEELNRREAAAVPAAAEAASAAGVGSTEVPLGTPAAPAPPDTTEEPKSPR
jgi:anti-sigma factor RsiW